MSMHASMGAVEEEKGVLKLVHAGAFVEMHRKPIYAHQVMKKNPRHCVTRPDFFKYPWIVVSPGSLLKLGSVFYIVPNHTIHSLLQSHKPHPQQLAQEISEEDDKAEINTSFVKAGARPRNARVESERYFRKAAPKPCLRNGQDKRMFHVRKVTFRLPDVADDNCSEEKVKRWLLDRRS